ncbi:MAG: beta-N-acetylhexosaminidase [Chlamydiales bacterium]|nr:beta-N-acetylhexosaminidase [Chlamydiales bacterium]
MLKQILFLTFFLFGTLQAELSLEEKVGQLFFGFVYGESLDESSKAFLQRTCLGNVVYYRWANALTSPAQVRALSEQLTETITVAPPIIAVDQEGGRVCRLTHGFTAFNTNSVLGALEDPSIVHNAGVTIAKELADCGINMNFAPVVDVNSNPDNPVIGSRSYHSDPDVVVAMARQFMAGHKQARILTALKHFPGHGDTNLNSHHSLPVISKSLEQLEQTELLPFKALAGQVDMIMTAHILVPALDPNSPATFSAPILTGLLRGQWGYQGIVISDSLVMRAAAPNQSNFEEAVVSVSRASISAFNAGCDCLIIGALEWADFTAPPQQNLLLIERVITSFTEAVRAGHIDLDQVEVSYNRVMSLKHNIQ